LPPSIDAVSSGTAVWPRRVDTLDDPGERVASIEHAVGFAKFSTLSTPVVAN
jgi:hypothetical protein